jgi:hypothetical protein
MLCSVDRLLAITDLAILPFCPGYTACYTITRLGEVLSMAAWVRHMGNIHVSAVSLDTNGTGRFDRLAQRLR